MSYSFLAPPIMESFTVALSFVTVLDALLLDTYIVKLIFGKPIEPTEHEIRIHI